MAVFTDQFRLADAEGVQVQLDESDLAWPNDPEPSDLRGVFPSKLPGFSRIFSSFWCFFVVWSGSLRLLSVARRSMKIG